ncbi:MAG: hypothetical protein R3D59_09255 [Paracoccaceae bacterium]
MKATGKTMLGTALAMLLSGASSVALAQDDITIAGVLINTQDPFWTSIGCGADARAKELGATLELYSIPNMDAAQMTAAFDAAILSQPDGLFGTSTAQPVRHPVRRVDGEWRAGRHRQRHRPGRTIPHRMVFGDTAPYIDEQPVADDPGRRKRTMLVRSAASKAFPARNALRADGRRGARGTAGFTELERVPTPSSTSTGNLRGLRGSDRQPDLKLIVASNGPDGIGAAAAVKKPRASRVRSP